MLAVLLQDHDLAVNDERGKNLNRFMAHIGKLGLLGNALVRINHRADNFNVLDRIRGWI